MSKGFLLIISGPAGTGKGTVCKALLERNKDIIYSISATTRKPRVGEVEGVNYFFIDEEEFKRMEKNDEFLEHAYVHTNYYGTPKKFVMDEVNKGEIVLLEIDVQGALQIKNNYSEAVFVFLLPPTMEELKNRIVKRGTETEEDINRRFENAFKELDFVGKYDYFVVNDKIEDAVSDIETIIKAEKLRVKRHSDIKDKVISQGGK
ncbi:guanylate kinase [Tissierella sp. P1]|jgi:guanylate kinase|uniref:guanylate kinase n=1 Tax=Tissierella TaxID=41273 RepID=UPI000BA0E4D8|nr:guanylate kinase [Tissierella sp. P1]MDU5083143.1 guanylate kinase [Bacillota bacterium]OZV12849.1 guanylate kinase [Tissierella sp. P1]